MDFLYNLKMFLRRILSPSLRRSLLKSIPGLEFFSNSLSRDCAPRLDRKLTKLQMMIAKVTTSELADLSYESGKLYILTPDNFKLWFNEKGINSTLWHCAKGYSHEGPERVMLTKYVRPNAIILDIGAGCGLHAMSFARADPSATVYSFEPVKTTFDTLQENVLKNGFADRIRCIHSAVGDTLEPLHVSIHKGPLDFIVPEEYLTNNRKRSSLVQSTTIDSFVNHQRLSVTGIKVDVEGYEVHVLRGAMNVLQRDKPWVYCEAEPGWLHRAGTSFEELRELLLSVGYSVFWVDGNGMLNQIDNRPATGNNIFAHRL